jgi:transcriptional regulator with XRE-family HTH domain
VFMSRRPQIGRKRSLHVYLAEWRTDKGLTQQQLGDRLGKSDVTVSRWETGERRPDDDTRVAIAEALGIDPLDLFRRPEEQSADALLRDQPPEIVDQAMKLIRAIRQ